MGFFKWRTHPGGSPGFSLAELMVGLVLTGIMLSASIPPLSRYLRDHQLQGWAENMSADLRLCRQRAVAQGNNFVFSWDAVAGSYAILDDRNDNGAADAGEPTIGPRRMPDTLILTNGPDNAFAGTSVTFLPSGGASQGGQVTLANQAGMSRVIQLLRPTGLVRTLS